jgi:hypothetical protein
MKLILKISLLLIISFLKVNAQTDAESKVPAYTLPDILKASSGQNINNSVSWERIRRPEVLRLFEDNVYGQMPRDFENIKYDLTNDETAAMNGKAHLKEVTINVDRAGKSVAIHLTLFVPNNRKKPAPVFLLINNRPPDNTLASRATKSEFWPAEILIDSGYAIAAFKVADAAPDEKKTYMNGVLQLYPDQLTKDNGMKAIGAWAWAASRVMDYFKTNKDLDFKKVAVVGHSRGGKAALWAGAEDQRFAIVIANCSGNTGAALSRRQFGETVKVINTNFPHWFTNNYKKYNDDVNALPVDQHMLISLIAPRPVYTTNASKDLWADPKGSYLSLINAVPVYELYNKHAALTPEPPAINTAIINSVIGYHNREGIHDLTVFDWTNFIRFANFNYKRK